LELNLSIFLGGVVDDSGSKDGFHEAVDFVLGEDLVVVFEEGFLGFGSDEEGEAFVEELVKRWCEVLLGLETDTRCVWNEH
jgi:hypothetical protein